MKRTYKDSRKQKIYNHYKSADIKRNILATDRHAYWFGRFGYNDYQAMVPKDSQVYPAWAAGYDLFRESGAPTDFTLMDLR